MKMSKMKIIIKLNNKDKMKIILIKRHYSTHQTLKRICKIHAIQMMSEFNFFQFLKLINKLKYKFTFNYNLKIIIIIIRI